MPTSHYNMWTALEEGMEMFGVMVLIYAVLDFMQGDAAGAVTVEVPPGSLTAFSSPRQGPLVWAWRLRR